MTSFSSPFPGRDSETNDGDQQQKPRKSHSERVHILFFSLPLSVTYLSCADFAFLHWKDGRKKVSGTIKETPVKALQQFIYRAYTRRNENKK